MYGDNWTERLWGLFFEKGRAYINKVFYWVVKTFFFCLLKKDTFLFYPDTLLIQKHLISLICGAQNLLRQMFSEEART